MPFKNPHPLHGLWRGMRSRCNNPNHSQWKDYGGRGIKICERWNTFANFVADMGIRPPGMMIDRIDNDGPYAPENCRWVSRRESQANRRVTVWLEIEGKRYRAMDLAPIAGLKADTIIARARKGLSYAEVMDPRRRVYLPGLALGVPARQAKRRQKKAEGH